MLLGRGTDRQGREPFGEKTALCKGPGAGGAGEQGAQHPSVSMGEKDLSSGVPGLWPQLDIDRLVVLGMLLPDGQFCGKPGTSGCGLESWAGGQG